MRYILVLLAASFAWGQTTETVITDTVRIPVSGGLVNGRVVVTPSHRMTCGSNSYAPIPVTIQIVNGALSLSLVPNSACTPVDGDGDPASYYTARFADTVWGGGGWTETWVVPVSAVSVPLSTVRSSIPAAATATIALAQITQSGATTNQVATWNGSNWAPAASTPAAHASTHAVAGSDPAIIAQSQVTDLVTNLSGKAAASHGHNASTDLTSGEVPAARGGLGADASAYTGFVRMDAGTPSASAIVTADLPAAIDFSAKTSTAPVKSGTSLPATCTTNEFYNKSDEPAGEGLHSCTSANTWTKIVGTGGGSVTTYEVTSFIASFISQTSVTLAHNFGTLKQQLTCQDAAGKFVEPKDFTPGSASSVVTFANAQTGACALVGGTGLYEESFTGQTSVNLDHDFNTTNIAIQCYDGADKRIEWKDATATDANNALVTFTNAQDGRCNVAATLATGAGGGSGTVTSVGLTVPSGFTVSGSPVTTSGVLAVSLDSQTAYKFLGVGASTAVPSFQTIPAAALAVMTGDSGSGGVKGAVPAPAAGDAAAGKYLKADGTWAAPAGGSGTGDVTMIQATATLSSWGAITAAGTSGSCVRKNITLAGAVAGDVVNVGPPSDIEVGLKWDGLAGTDVAIVQLCNNTGASITPADGRTFRVQVNRSTL